MALSDDESQRRKVTWLLAEEDSRKATAILYKLLDDSSEIVRTYAVKAICNSEAPRIDCSVLREHLSDPSPYVRAEIIAAIQIRCRRLLRRVTLTLARDEEEIVRAHLALAIGKRHSRRKKFVKTIRLLLDDRSELVRRYALRAVGHAKMKILKHEVVSALSDPDSSVRGAAALALADLYSKKSIDTLAARLDEEEDDRAKLEMATALAQLEEVSGVYELSLYAALSSNPVVKADAKKRLVELGIERPTVLDDAIIDMRRMAGKEDRSWGKNFKRRWYLSQEEFLAKIRELLDLQQSQGSSRIVSRLVSELIANAKLIHNAVALDEESGSLGNAET